MKIHTLPLGMLQANCYVLHCDGSAACIVIDPGDDPRQLLGWLKEHALQPEAVLLTHRHFDHVGAVQAVKEAYSCPVYMHPGDVPYPAGIPFGADHCTHTLADGQTLSLAGIAVQVLHTPGHSEGCVCFLVDDAHLFTGDTLFADACGRVDFTGSSPAKMQQSLQRLASLEGSLRVYPGHGPATTLAREKQYNPYLSNNLKGML